MGRRRARPFIDRRTAAHYLLVHRSQRDAARAGEEEASEHVLVPASGRSTANYVMSQGQLAAEDAAEDVWGEGEEGEDADEDGDDIWGNDEEGDGEEKAGDDSTGKPGAAAAAPRVPSQGERGGARASSKRSRPAMRDMDVSVRGGSRVRVREVAEVDEDGFPLDGYDYRQHMRTGGGGVFVAVTGQISTAVRAPAPKPAAVALPPEVLPSDPSLELDRMLEAISLRPDTLPPDIRHALEAAEDVDDEDEVSDRASAVTEEGVVGKRVKLQKVGLEELDDDFVMQAAGVTQAAGGAVSAVADDFDFDAHVQRLMRGAEGKWTDTADDFDGAEEDDGDELFDDEDAPPSRRHATASRDELGGRLDEGMLAAILEQYDDEDIGELDDDDPRLHAFNAEAAALRSAPAGGSRAVLDAEPAVSSRRRHAAADADDDDDDNDALQEQDDDEYDDDDGDYDDDDEAEGGDAVRRPAEVPSSTSMPNRMTEAQFLSAAMDTYLEEAEQRKKDVALITGVRPGSKTVRAKADKPAASSAPAQPESQPLGDAADAPASAPASAAFTVSTSALASASSAPSSLPTREVPFGCADGDFAETDVSALPAAWRAKPKPKWDVETVHSSFTCSEHQPRRVGVSVSLTSDRTGHAARSLAPSVALAGPVIRLSKKTGLPLPARPPREPPVAPEPAGSDADADTHTHTHTETEGRDGHARVSTRPREETAEEKRLRKAAVKTEQRERRQTKKAVREAFDSARVRLSHMAAHRDALAGAVHM